MRTKNKTLIIDSDRQRVEKISAIINFIDELSEVRDFEDWNETDCKQAKLILVGAHRQAKNTIKTIEKLENIAPDIPCVIIADHHIESIPFKNVVGVLTFPFSYNDMLRILHKCQQMTDKLIKSRVENSNPAFRQLVGSSQQTNSLRQLIIQVADTDASVLILGESGTGKEVVARNIHTLSPRAEKPFVPINCGAIPAELLESELFGHEKGAFTGAITARQGRFELANGGTLFLDEIGDMPLPMQVKLLRVLQERCFERVGSNKSVKMDVRIIAATHRYLEQEIADGKFREDLFYRLNVFPIDILPLRNRNDDIEPLIYEICSRLKDDGRPIVRLMPKALNCLRRYHWPGNVRELANFVERMAILYPDGVVDIGDLPERYKEQEARLYDDSVPNNNLISEVINSSKPSLGLGLDLREHLAKTEVTLINQALESADWVVSHAAIYLNMRRTTLVEKIRKYGLVRPD